MKREEEERDGDGCGSDDNTTKAVLSLPGGPLHKNQTYEEAAIQHLADHNIDVCSPQNCLHHLFTFPMEFDSPKQGFAGVWGDFYEVRMTMMEICIWLRKQA